jgi:hypothetical protein
MVVLRCLLDWYCVPLFNYFAVYEEQWTYFNDSSDQFRECDHAYDKFSQVSRGFGTFVMYTTSVFGIVSGTSLPEVPDLKGRVHYMTCKR